MKIIFQILLAISLAWFWVSVEDRVTRALRILNSNTDKPLKKKILFAFSSDEDIQVQAITLLRELGCSKEDRNQKNICSSILFHFENGLGSELHVTEGFDNIVQISKRISTSKDLGGNAAQMALRAFKEGGDVYLSAIMSNHYYENLFNSSISIIPQSFLREEIRDVHIVINFDEGDIYDTIICQHTNRLYLQNDQDNMRFPGLENLEANINSIHPDLLVIGGFQLMNQKPKKEYQEIILKLEQILIGQKNKLKIHFEMGAFNDENLLLYLIEHIFPHVHSTGMNEQELQLLYNFITKKQLEQQQINTNQQLELIIKLFQELNLERVHFHSQTIQMICSNQNWREIKPALHRSILVGLIQAMKSYNDNQIDQKYLNVTHLQMALEEEDLILYPSNTVLNQDYLIEEMNFCWHLQDQLQHQCCLAPVLINPHPMRTCGLGDNIGSTSLLYQLK
ncbi:unnamed protein product (macronuclear) [Paramecium tetraurelia]|uniref:ADP-dependent glucokinase n=1 Tax=Paramecium tetraurelia TaxID=5888 RepID=A0EDG2_PARTE|nr:uncharacterized protein GSPATT00004198001 [Paramecium tetraurelia]CAK93329.1 unnamed protein product [Paramecium tetraurelia]|eukprot:XP_001460726.1 hypothetical protein (macronuclear) [Paramecium tetraurelia strain d4-2]